MSTTEQTNEPTRKASARRGAGARSKPASSGWGPLVRLLPFIARYPFRFSLMVGFVLLGTASSLVLPSFAGGIIDKGFSQHNLESVSNYGWLVILFAGLMAIANGARLYFTSVLGERVLTDLRQALFDHLLTLDLQFFDTHRVGELTSRLTGDVGAIRGAITATLTSGLRNAVTLIGAIVLMLFTSPYLTIAVLILVPALTIPITVIGRRLRRMSRRAQDAIADLSAMATEALAATRTIKAFSQEPIQSNQYRARSEESYVAQTSQVVAHAALGALMTFGGTVILVVLVWWGAKAVVDGFATAGQLTQFMIYVVMASNAVSSLSDTAGNLQSVAGATERITEILDTTPQLRQPAQPRPMPQPPLGTIRFDHVSFSYANRGVGPVLDDISFDIRAGEKAALVGASGAGKSTIFAIVQRFYDVTSGTVFVDGNDVREVDQQALRRHFAYVEQEPAIFGGTIADNIRFGKPDAGLEEIREAAAAALVDDYVRDLPDGYNTLVGERGIMLSGGQKQRLAIARALLKNAPILLLDEATSALDAESERLVQIALARLMQGRTSLAIAHRLATIRDADHIIVLDKGHVLDEGTHQTLIRTGGRYAELARLQFRNEVAAPAAE